MRWTRTLMKGLTGPVAGLLALLSGCAPAVLNGVPSLAVADARPAPGPLPATLVLPPGPGPHPVVIVLHGCGGLSQQRMQPWVDRLLDWGYGSLVLDSLTPRSVTSVCARDRQRLVTSLDRAGDVVSAVAWLQFQPGVDGHRLAVLGQSHGGATAATVTLHPYADEVAGKLRAAVNYYGNCRDARRYGGIPLMALAGDADTWGPPAATCTSFARSLPAGSPFHQTVYPGAVHAFESPSIVVRRMSEGHPMQYDPAAAADSFIRVRAFLGETVGPPG